MAKLVFVVAVSANGVIGQNGKLPWHLPSELQRFKALTWGKPIIMGRKSWDSLPRKPLPGRQNIILTTQKEFSAPGAEVAHSVEEALSLCGPSEEIAVIGGGEIYKLFYPFVERIYMTVVHLKVGGDTYFMPLPSGEWQETSRQDFPPSPPETTAYSLLIYDRFNSGFDTSIKTTTSISHGHFL